MKRWLPYVKPYWVYFVVGPLLMIIEVLGEVFMPKFMASGPAEVSVLNTSKLMSTTNVTNRKLFVPFVERF